MSCSESAESPDWTRCLCRLSSTARKHTLLAEFLRPGENKWRQSTGRDTDPVVLTPGQPVTQLSLSHNFAFLLGQTIPRQPARVREFPRINYRTNTHESNSIFLVFLTKHVAFVRYTLITCVGCSAIFLRSQTNYIQTRTPASPPS